MAYIKQEIYDAIICNYVVLSCKSDSAINDFPPSHSELLINLLLI